MNAGELDEQRQAHSVPEMFTGWALKRLKHGEGHKLGRMTSGSPGRRSTRDQISASIGPLLVLLVGLNGMQYPFLRNTIINKTSWKWSLKYGDSTRDIFINYGKPNVGSVAEFRICTFPIHTRFRSFNREFIEWPESFIRKFLKNRNHK